MTLDPWLRENLVCPLDRGALAGGGKALRCERGHTYPVVAGIPVMLVADDVPTHDGVFAETLAAARTADVDRQELAPDEIDPYVQRMVAGTCGFMYRPLIGKLTEYPIPDFPLPEGLGAPLLDIGCGWGRWSVAAARKGYRPVGLDPSLEAVGAAARVASQLGVGAIFVAGDARRLPFRDNAFAAVHSYSVLMHMAKEDVREILPEVARVLHRDGRAIIQMANALGVRNLCRRVRKGSREFDDPGSFAVRYWTPRELLAAFETAIGPSHLSVDGFFFTSAGRTSFPLLPLRYRTALRLSSALARFADFFSPLGSIADSLYVHAAPRPGPTQVSALE